MCQIADTVDELKERELKAYKIVWQSNLFIEFQVSIGDDLGLRKTPFYQSDRRSVDREGSEVREEAGEQGRQRGQ